MKSLFGLSKSIVALIALFVITVILGGFAYAGIISAANQQKQELSKVNASLVSLGKQYAQDAEAIAAKKKILEASAEHFGSIESSAGFLLGDENIKSFTAEKVNLQEVLKTIPAKFAVINTVAVKPEGNFVWDYNDAVAEGHRKLDAASKLKKVQDKALKSLEAKEKTAQATVTKVVSSADASSDSLLAANTKTSPEVRTSFSQAKEVLKSQSSGNKSILDDKAVWAAFTGWVSAGKSVVDSQAAAVLAEQQAAAEEAARQAEEVGSGSSNSGFSGSGSYSEAPKPSSGNSGSPGGSGASSGGSSSSSGGGSAPSTPSAPSVNPRGSIVHSGTCSGSGGSASGNWESNLIAPSNAINVSVSFQNPGSSWGISWQCDTGW